MFAARERGIHFDVGHGAGSFSWSVVESAMQQGILPDSLSSALHIYNVDGPVYDLANVINKFLLLGLTVEEAFAKATSVPAGIIGITSSRRSRAHRASNDSNVCSTTSLP